MRKIILLLFILTFSITSFAQKYSTSLKGKKIVTIGNSITASCGWQQYLVDSLDVLWSAKETLSGVNNYQPMAVGGTMVRPTVRRSIFNRSFDAKYYKPDIILIYGGQNDRFSNMWGSITDIPYLKNEIDTTVTLASAYMGMIECLIRDNPQAKIYLITLMRVKAVVGMHPVRAYTERYKSPRFESFQSVLNWEKEQRYPKVQLIKQIGEKYNLPIIDLYEKSGVTNENAEFYYGMSADDCTQVHPNKAGYKVMAKLIISELIKQ